MNEVQQPIVDRMQVLIQQWEQQADQRALFLSCYQMMTRNMLAAIDRCEFRDPAWVNRLLHLFADYYFVALDAYNQDPLTAPAVWQVAHQSCVSPQTWALQKLLLGVNAHINYDLVLTTVDLLRPEWADLAESLRNDRYADYCTVNDIIARTIDAVQDQILEPAMPGMDLVDVLLGQADEHIISQLITGWRETVWQYATRLMVIEDPQAYALLVKEVETQALQRADAIRLTNWRAVFRNMI